MSSSLEAMLKRFRKDQNEYKELNELNGRFMSFLTAVKEESKRNETLETSLLQQRQEHFKSICDANATYYKSLVDAKRNLNEVCYGLNQELVKQRHNRTMADWYSKLSNFELSLLKSKSGAMLNSNFSEINLVILCQSNPTGLNENESSNLLPPVSSTPDPIIAETNCLLDNNLSSLSHISVSQSSLVSCSSTSFSLTPSTSSSMSSSGAGSSSFDENANHQPVVKCEFDKGSHHSSSNSISQGFQSESSSTCCFSLEAYLSSLNRTCSELRCDYEKKLNECIDLKENVLNLNNELTSLNDNLDQVRVENITLKDSIKNMEMEVEFLKKKNSLSSSKQDSNENKEWLMNELKEAKKGIEAEYADFANEQLEFYEEELKNELMDEIDTMDDQLNKDAELFDTESNQIIDELIELNGQLADDLVEYEKVQLINLQLNTRLVEISSNLTAYTSMSDEQKEFVILKYSNRTLESELATLRTQIKDMKKELASIKEKHVEKSAACYVKNSSIIQQPDKSKLPTSKPKAFQPNKIVGKESKKAAVKKAANVIKFTPTLDNNEFVLLDHLKLNQKFQLRSNYAQIEYTKSHLFAYFVIKFDLIFNINSFKQNASQLASSLPPSSTPNNGSKSILSNLRIISDSFDGHSIIIENSHKILDIDLSDWTLRREIYNSGPFIDNNQIYNEILSKCSTIDIENSSSEPSVSESDVEIIEYKFPKNFKLKRRKKINLIAAGGGRESSSKLAKLSRGSLSKCSSFSCTDLSRNPEPSPPNNQMTPASSTLSLVSDGGSSTTSMSSVKSKLIASKCACCSCKMLVKRKGDVEFFELDEIPSWGSGILVITKLVNNKNAVKLVNFKFLKHIWVNNTKHQ